MVLIDTNILSTFALIDRLSLLWSLFEDNLIYISPNVFTEVTKAKIAGYSHADKILNVIKEDKIKLLIPTKEEILLSMELPMNFGYGERDSVIIAQRRGMVFVTNEKKIIKYCQNEKIGCLWLEKILRSLWKENILSKEEVKIIMDEIEAKDNLIIPLKDEILKD